MFSNNDALRLAAEGSSGGKLTVLFDDLGKPSYMVKIPKFKIKDVLEGGSDEWHPMFLVGNEVKDAIYISQYQNIVESDRAYSLPHRDPSCYITRDVAKAACERKGRGWHLMSNAEWAGIAMWCKANGFMPHGNNHCGCDINFKWEKGEQSYDYILTYNWNGMANSYDGAKYHHTGRCFTGSGPATWTHDGTPCGIYDLNGNVWEWVTGMRCLEGEIQVIPNNNSALGVDETRESTLWKAIKADGTLVTPGTTGTLKYDSIKAGDATQTNHSLGAIRLSDVITNPHYTGGSTEAYYGYGTNSFETLTAKTGITPPEILKVLGLYPYDTEVGGHYADGFWARNYGERCPFRGGDWLNSAGTGVFALSLHDSRAHSAASLGFRSAFVEL